MYRRGNFNGTFDDLICDALLERRDAEIVLSPGFRWGTTVLPGAAITVEDIHNATAITYPQVYRLPMTGGRLKDILEDVADNLFNPDPYYQQGGDMVRVGGLEYSIEPSAKMGGRISDMRLNGKLIDADKQKKNELQARLREEQDISKLLSEMLANKPAILLVRDNENVVLNLMQAVYIETWGKMVRQIMIKKYYCGNDKIFSAKPDFADIWKNEKSRKTEIVKSTEEDHLKACSEIARNIYNEIKTALLKADNSIEFNAKKIYISVRKNKNLAFFHLRKKISLVVMCPEEDVRKQIKYHEIKSLPASVQKFWNGASCTIVIENSANIAEVINLLKKMIAKS